MNCISKLLTWILGSCLSFQTEAQTFLKVENEIIKLDNGIITREISFVHDSLCLRKLFLNGSDFNFSQPSCDFSMLVDNNPVDGFSDWQLIHTEAVHDTAGGKGVKITLILKRQRALQIDLYYILYPQLPIIRKWVVIKNLGKRQIKIEALNIEDFTTNLDFVNSVVYHNYARMKQLGRFVGNWDDPVVVVHDIRNSRGMALGNEAPGVLKRTAYHTKFNDISIGLTSPGQNFPFRKWLKANQEWESPRTFIALYSGNANGFEVVENEVNRFIINYMQPKILQLKSKPVFVYNSWFPFRTFVSDSLIRSLAKSASECGIEEFVIDDGWQKNLNGTSSGRGWGENYGDWMVDTAKFKGGLKLTFDYIKSLGMKPGLWISLASATKDSKVFQEHPEWFVQNAKGKPGNIHYPSNSDDGFYSASFGTEWVNYIKGKILRLVNEYGLSYAKLDLAVVTSPYINNDSISGSYATHHPFYKDHNESFIVCYQRLLQLFDELHRKAPELFIDCTFESVGKLHLMDYAFAQHADGNWMSNFEEPSPLGPLRVRQLAWWRSPALPASAMVIGNQSMNDSNFILCLKSLIGTLPIMLGDPRKIEPGGRQLLKKWSVWMRNMQNKYEYMTYRKDLEGFGEPLPDGWDGWQRINFNTHTGGIFAVFRNGASEDTRKIFLKDLDPEKYYVVRLAPEGEIICRAKGNDLLNKGITIEIKNTYDGNIYEVGQE